MKEAISNNSSIKFVVDGFNTISTFAPPVNHELIVSNGATKELAAHAYQGCMSSLNGIIQLVTALKDSGDYKRFDNFLECKGDPHDPGETFTGSDELYAWGKEYHRRLDALMSYREEWIKLSTSFLCASLEAAGREMAKKHHVEGRAPYVSMVLAFAEASAFRVRELDGIRLPFNMKVLKKKEGSDLAPFRNAVYKELQRLSPSVKVHEHVLAVSRALSGISEHRAGHSSFLYTPEKDLSILSKEGLTRAEVAGELSRITKSRHDLDLSI